MTRRDPERGRFSSRRKMEAVLRLLRGEDLDSISRELQVTAATLSEWREAFVAGGQASLKSRQPDVRDEENAKLKALVGELSMRNEVLREANRRLQDGLPLARRRSRS
jgi:transposase